MENFAYFSSTFDILKTNTYRLNLGLKPCSITYTIVDTVRNKCVVIKHFVFKRTNDIEEYYEYIKKFLNEDTFLTKHYKKINFVFSSPKSILVPLEFFNKRALSEYFTLSHNICDYEELHFNRLEKLNLANVFSIPAEITVIMVNKFPELRFYHQSTTLIENFVEKSLDKECVVGVFVCTKYLHITVAKRGVLELYNHVEYSNADDILYFIMNIYKQLNLPEEETYMYLMGKITKESKTYHLLSEYLNNIQFAKTLSERKMQYNFKEVPEHMVANLLSVK